MAYSACAQLRVVNYNTLDKPFSQSDLDDLSIIVQAISDTPRNGVAKRPDILALQEQTTFSLNDSTSSRVAEALNSLFGVSSYQASVLGFGVDRLGVVFDSATVGLSSSSNIPTGGPRAAQRAEFSLLSYAGEQLYLYNAHLKAGSSSADNATRATEASNLVGNLASLGPNVNAVALGDMNIGSSSEAAFDALTDSGSPGFSDPLALGAWPNSSVAVHMTQSTRTSFLSDEGATGGMDDRFDLQLVTSPLLDGEGLSYLGPTSVGLESLEHSYQAFGNDGVSWNTRINNTFVGRTQTADVLNALHDFSDHLPVVADYQLPAVLEVLTAPVPETLAVGEPFTLDVTVRNAAEVLVAVGADELDYELSVSGDLSGQASGSVLALSGGDTISVALDTSVPGMRSGLLSVTTASQGAANALVELPISFEVIAAGLAGDFDGSGVVDAADYTVWRDGLGVDYVQSDYLTWRANFGQSAGGVGGSAAPEPAAMLLVFTALGWSAPRRWWSGRRD
ncbi:hypothetical protein KOR34_25740 [Posidoniimonas corsicana]|uniref:Endonuclease/Exonuclease/phosphatase family protein n=1 Tax=Posidoniimonas corsicana TaxID=1938618 RepID=A0A5C5VG14_9BACT|nr:hypothetical protein [Posidoniimonas corsicana]TWT37618.1 hypothetical protein KOR34_25740 [Posidoniimonas corsicana]